MRRWISLFCPRPGMVAGIAAVLVFLGVSAVSALYVWTDESGVTHITEYPDPRQADEVTEQLKYRGPERATAPQPPAPEGTEPSRPAPERPAIRFSARPPASDTGLPGDAASGRTPAPTPEETPPRERASGPDQFPPEAQRQIEEALKQLPLSAEQQRELQQAFRQLPGTPSGASDEDEKAAAGLVALIMALFAGFFVVIMVVAVAGWIYGSLCLYLIAKKLDLPNPWIAWIPLAQSWTLVEASGKPWWWILLFWLGWLIFAPVGLIVTVMLWISIVENLSLNKWLGLLWIVPVANLVLLGYLAFSKNATPAAAGMEEGFGWDSEASTEGAPADEEYSAYPDVPDLPPDEPYEEQYEEPEEPPPLPR